MYTFPNFLFNLTVVFQTKAKITEQSTTFLITQEKITEISYFPQHLTKASSYLKL
jgi:hypothetical protein